MHIDVNVLRNILVLGKSTEMKKREISKFLDIDHSTVIKYLNKSDEIGVSLELARQASDEELKSLFFQVRRASKRKALPNIEYILKELNRTGMTKILLYDEYKEEYADNHYGYTWFCNYIKEYVDEEDLYMLQVHRWGERILIDFSGKTTNVRNKKTKKVEKYFLFAAAMPKSGMTFYRACKQQTTDAYITSMMLCLLYFGAAPKVVTPDNTRAVINKSGKRRVVQKDFQYFCDYHSITVISTRPYSPQDKAIIEGMIRVGYQNIFAPLRDELFFSEEELNAAIFPLMEALNDKKTKRFPDGRRHDFEKYEKPAMLTLPTIPYEHMKSTNFRTVNGSYHIDVEGHLYSVPHICKNKKVFARYDDSIVQIIHENKKVATHKRSFEMHEKTTDFTHMTVAHQYEASKCLTFYLAWAEKIGPNSVHMVEAQYKGEDEKSLIGIDRCEQLKHLCGKYDQERFERACAYAVMLRTASIDIVENYLIEQSNITSTTNSKTIRPPQHLRGPDHYRGIQ